MTNNRHRTTLKARFEHVLLRWVKNKSIPCWCQRLAVGCLIKDKKSKSKQRHNSGKQKAFWILSPLIIWYSEFQVNIFSNNRDIQKCQSLHHDNNKDAKAIAISWVFSEISQANNTWLCRQIWKFTDLSDGPQMLHAPQVCFGPYLISVCKLPYCPQNHLLFVNCFMVKRQVPSRCQWRKL